MSNTSVKKKGTKVKLDSSDKIIRGLGYFVAGFYSRNFLQLGGGCT